MLKFPVDDKKTRQELAAVDGILVVQVQRRYRGTAGLFISWGVLARQARKNARVVGSSGLEIRYENDLGRSHPKQLQGWLMPGNAISGYRSNWLPAEKPPGMVATVTRDTGDDRGHRRQTHSHRSVGDPGYCQPRYRNHGQPPGVQSLRPRGSTTDTGCQLNRAYSVLSRFDL